MAFGASHYPGVSFGGGSSQGIGIFIRLYDHFTAPATRVSRAMRILQRDANHMRGVVDKASQHLIRGASLAAASTLFVRPFALGISEAMKFEHAMQRVFAVTNTESSREMKQLNDLAERVGKTTSFTMLQVAKLQEKLGMAGFSVKEILDSVLPSVYLGEIGQIDPQSAGDIATNILRAFQLEAKEMSRIADILAKTITSTNVSISSLAESFRYAGSYAQSLGMDVAETAAAIGLLGQIGIKGSRAGTSIKNLATNITQDKEVMRELGITPQTFIDKQTGKFISFNRILLTFKKALDELPNQAQRVNIAYKIFQKRGYDAFKAFAVASEGNSYSFKSLLKVLRDSTGEAQTLSTRLLDTARGRVIKLNSAVEALKITLGRIFLKALGKVADGVRGIVNAISDFVKTPLGQVLSVITAGVAGLTLTMAAGLITIGLYNYSIIGLAKSYRGAKRQAIELAIAQRGVMAGSLVMLNATKANIIGKRGIWGGLTLGASKFLGLLRKLPALLYRSLKWIIRFPVKNPLIAGIAAVVAVIRGLVMALRKGIYTFKDLDSATDASLSKMSIFKRLMVSLGGLFVGILSALSTFQVANDRATGRFKTFFILTRSLRDKLHDFGLLEPLKWIMATYSRMMQFFDGMVYGFRSTWKIIGEPLIAYIKQIWTLVVDTFTAIGVEIFKSFNIDFDKTAFSHKSWNQTGMVIANVIAMIGTGLVGLGAGIVRVVGQIVHFFGTIWNNFDKLMDYIKAIRDPQEAIQNLASHGNILDEKTLSKHAELDKRQTDLKNTLAGFKEAETQAIEQMIKRYNELRNEEGFGFFGYQGTGQQGVGTSPSAGAASPLQLAPSVPPPPQFPLGARPITHHHYYAQPPAENKEQVQKVEVQVGLSPQGILEMLEQTSSIQNQ